MTAATQRSHATQTADSLAARRTASSQACQHLQEQVVTAELVDVHRMQAIERGLLVLGHQQVCILDSRWLRQEELAGLLGRHWGSRLGPGRGSACSCG